MLVLLTLGCLLQNSTEPIVTPYYRKENLQIRSVKSVVSTVKQYDVEELVVDLGATFDNPFDSSDVILDADITSPKGDHFKIPGFFYRPFERSIKDGKELVTPTGEGSWRIRICPRETGKYVLEIAARDRTGSTPPTKYSFDASPSDSHGMITVSPRNRQYFEFSDGTSYFPIGANVSWGNAKGTYSYDEWIPDYSKVGANYMRFWLGPSWVTFAMEVSGKSEEGHGFGQIELANAWKLDQVMAKAQQSGIQVMLTIDSYNTLRSKDGFPAWDKAPQNRDNGGPLRIWSDFWTNSKVESFYKAKLRYLVARYSAFSNLMSWEFWNEVDLTQDYSAEVVRNWHMKMGDELRGLDPYHHLVTTSIADSMGDRNLDLIPQLDYAQTHSYNTQDVAGSVLYQQARKAEWGKPHYVGEIGADSNGPRDTEDPQGMQIHDPLWMSMVAGSSGSAMPWWWDSLIAPHHLYPIFGAAAKFGKGIDWAGEDFRRSTLSVGYLKSPKLPERKDLEFDGGPIQWNAGDGNRPHVVSINGSTADGELPLPGIQHGVRNHRDWHNPVRFKVNLKQATKFEVVIGEVSGFGGAILQVSLDGDPIMTREFQSGENGTKGASVKSYSGRYAVTIPPGDHTLLVENIGNDWFMCSYRFVNLVKRNGPAIQGWALEGNNTVIAWLRPEGRSWRRVIVDKIPFSSTVPCLVALEGLASGDWNYEIWDTWTGTVLSTKVVHVGLGGKIHLEVPSFARDLAIKLRRTTAHRS